MNKIILAGRLGQTPQLRFTNTKKMPVTTLRIATKEMGITVWHNVTVWGDEAQRCCKYLEKGSSCTIEGRISYQYDENGRSMPELVGQHVYWL